MLRELNIYEMEMVSGGSWTAADTIHGEGAGNDVWDDFLASPIGFGDSGILGAYFIVPAGSNNVPIP